uniref:Ig-like domain-containing protein n=1 Tax=Moschus moschiferus TaxID=68415 RepID=A0A8C6E0W6_MOSMO
MCCQVSCRKWSRERLASEHGGSLEQLVRGRGSSQEAPECEQPCEGSKGVSQVSLLTFWTPPTTARLTVETVPPLAAEGNDVLLLACNVPENPLGYAWHRGERVDNSQLIASYRVDTNVTAKGPAHSNRETVYPNGTLLIQNITQKDTGFHTLLVSKVDLETEGQTGHLCIYSEWPRHPHHFPSGSCYHPEANLTTLCPWLITRRPPQSIQELFIPNITADKSRSYNCLVRNFITGLSKTTVKAITVSGKWPLAHQDQTQVS